MITEIVKDPRIPNFRRVEEESGLGSLLKLKGLYETYIELSTRDGIYLGSPDAIWFNAALSQYLQQSVKKAA